MTNADVDHFRTFGFVVLGREVPAEALRAEVAAALGAGPASMRASGVANFCFAPMMSPSRSPQSLSLLDKFESCAAKLIGAPALPVRAKGMRYFGATGWHSDSTLPAVSLGFAAYLDPLTANNGALRVLPGSHRRGYGDEVAAFLKHAPRAMAVELLPGLPLATLPGDVIVFDEHLYHASTGGTERLQWRVDFVRAPTSLSEESDVRAYFAQIFTPNWDGGYDPDAWPSYGADWVSSGRAAVEPLRKLGVYDLAHAQERFMRTHRGAA